MTADPRAALDRLVAALEAHYHAVSGRRGPDDPAVDDAYDVLADAFDVYAEALGQVHGEALPFDIADEEEEDDDDGVDTVVYEVDKVPDEAFEDFDDDDGVDVEVEVESDDEEISAP